MRSSLLLDLISTIIVSLSMWCFVNPTHTFNVKSSHFLKFKSYLKVKIVAAGLLIDTSQLFSYLISECVKKKEIIEFVLFKLSLSNSNCMNNKIKMVVLNVWPFTTVNIIWLWIEWFMAQKKNNRIIITFCLVLLLLSFNFYFFSCLLFNNFILLLCYIILNVILN